MAYYHPRMRVGNVFGHVCLSVFLSVQAITFELLDIETSFLPRLLAGKSWAYVKTTGIQHYR